MEVSVVLNQMVVLFIIMLLGYFAYKKNIINDEASKAFSSLIVNITNPAFIISGVLGDSQIGDAKQVITVAVIATLMHLGLMIIGFIVTILMRIKKSENGLYNAMFVFSNIGFMGFPIISSIFGKEVLLYGAIFIIPFNVLVYTYGIYLLTKDKEGSKGSFSIKRIFNVGVIACIIAVLIYAFNIKLPSFVVSTVDMVGNVTTPLSMMVIGVSLAKINLKDLISDKNLYIFSIIKLLVIPIISAFIIKNFITDEIIYATTVLLLSTPVASMSVMLANEFDGNVELASKGVLVSTILSVITIPLVVFVVF